MAGGRHAGRPAMSGPASRTTSTIRGAGAASTTTASRIATCRRPSRSSWPGKARVALWVAVHVGHFPMDMPRQAVRGAGRRRSALSQLLGLYPARLRQPGRHLSPDAGARIARGLRATALMNAAVATRYPALANGDRRQPVGGRGGRRRHGPAASRRTARSRGAGAGEAGRRQRCAAPSPRRSAAGIRRPIPNRCARSISWPRPASTMSPTGSTTTCPIR